MEKNQEHSDVVFMVENQPIYMPKLMFSRRRVINFAAMFRSNMRERASRGSSNLPNCSNASFLKVLEYICLDDYSIVSIDDAVELVPVWQLADFYQLEGGLKYSCMGSLERGLW